MGFTCGLYRYPKCDDIVDISELRAVLHAVEYETNEWVSKNYTRADWMREYSYIPTKEQVKFYVDNRTEDGSGYLRTYREVESWCSAGQVFHDDVIELVCGKNDFNKNDSSVLLNRDDVIKILDYAWNKLKRLLPEPCCLERSFKVMPYYNNEFDTEPDIILSNCSGIEVEFPDSTVKRIYASDEYDFMASKESVDEDAYWALINLMDACIFILKEVDFENEFLEYSGGW